MRSYILGLGLMFSALNVNANSIQMEYDFEDYVENSKGFYSDDASAVRSTVGFDLSPNVRWDVGLTGRFEHGAANITQRLESGVTFTPVQGYFVRGAVSQEFTEKDNFTFYTIEPGFVHSISEKLNGVVRYRYRNAFDTDVSFETHTARGDLEYSLDENNIVGVGYDRVFNDIEANQFRVNYSRRF